MNSVKITPYVRIAKNNAACLSQDEKFVAIFLFY